jgi:hypothetical protein
MRDFSRHCPTSRVRLGLPRQQLMIRFSTMSPRCSSMREKYVILTREAMVSSDLPSMRLIYDLDCSILLLSDPHLYAIIDGQKAGGGAINSIYRSRPRNACFKRKSWIGSFSMSIRFINLFMNSRYVDLSSSLCLPFGGNHVAFVRNMIDVEIS